MRTSSLVSNSALPPEVTRLPDPILPVEDIDPPLPGENPRGEVTADDVADLRPSIREHGVLVPVLIRRDGDRYRIVAGERRWLAAKLENRATVPIRFLEVDSSNAAEIAIIENVQRKDMGPLKEAESYQRLVATSKTIDEVAARVGKSKQHVYRMLTLLRLVPKVQELLAADILPVHYAFKLATVAAERQEEGLGACFKPLFRDTPSRDQLEPLATLDAWIIKCVRLDPHSEDTRIFLPTLAEQVEEAEQVKNASVLAVSTLNYHTDRSDPMPILAKSWHEITGEDDRCGYAKPAVIVLGDRQGTYVKVCVAKRNCHQHWPITSGPAERPRTVAEVEGELASLKQQEANRAQSREDARWRNELRPRALKLVAEQTVNTSRPGPARVECAMFVKRRSRALHETVRVTLRGLSWLAL
jgi:ParB/RepB/Spo0J family partition protein